jgi:hypothetical protein
VVTATIAIVMLLQTARDGRRVRVPLGLLVSGLLDMAVGDSALAYLPRPAATA